MYIDYNEMDQFLQNCSDGELNSIINSNNQIRNFFMGISITAPNGTTYSVISLANDAKIRREVTNGNGQTGADIQKNPQRAAQKAEEIKQAYNALTSVEDATTQELKNISNMINELVQLDGTIGQYYQSISNIKNKVVSELEARQESSGTIDESAQNSLGLRFSNRN